MDEINKWLDEQIEYWSYLEKVIINKCANDTAVWVSKNVMFLKIIKEMINKK